MAIGLLPDFIRTYYEVHEWKHAIAILSQDFPEEWQDIDAMNCKLFLTRQGEVLRMGHLQLI